MNLPYINKDSLQQFIQNALAEDIGEGDHSSLAVIPAQSERQAKLIIKDKGVLAGVEMALAIFKEVDPKLHIEVKINDGTRVEFGDIGLTVQGSTRSILKAERLVLNCMQRMSGIATYTNFMNTLISGTGAKLLDTRKTTPNFRLAEKWAVVIGGGINHRYGLFDMIMLKDNHIDYAGGIKQAITASQDYLAQTGKNLKIEVETRNLDEVREVLEVGGISRIMLDNMDCETMTKAVKLIDKAYETEASGGINESTIRSVAETGVDYISVGALTHSVKSMDISLKAF